MLLHTICNICCTLAFRGRTFALDAVSVSGITSQKYQPRSLTYEIRVVRGGLSVIDLALTV